MTTKREPASSAVVAVGSLNRASKYYPDVAGIGISLFRFNEDSGELRFHHASQGPDNPAFLAYSAERRVLYAVSEIIDWNEGVVSAFDVDAESCLLSYINMQPTLGNVSAHVSLHPSQNFLAISNYSIGPTTDRPGRAVAVLPIGQGGQVLPPSDSRTHSFTGPNHERQERSHVHCSRFTPDGKALFVSEFGGDRIAVYPFDPAVGALGDPQWFDAAESGAGPRHLSLHPRHNVLYVSNELQGNVAAYRNERSSNALELSSVASTLPAGFSATPSTAEVTIHPSGRFVFASDRANNSIAVIALTDEGSKLETTSIVGTGGSAPRHFAVAPSGRWLIVGNQNSNTLAVMPFDAEQGTLGPPIRRIECGTPFCVEFLA
ncbi:MAG: lactonase family protein [Hyphomicrobiales bacterium]|nr:lactonase family protein [Hyphomicrobiales bacterium]